MSESAFQKVKLSDIQPNPFRRLDLYPLDKAKIAVLKSSMDRTDFWSNVVARERAGKFQIAYGHHRIEAAREAFGKRAEVSIIVRDLDDATMLKIMAADNSDAYNMSPGFILETVGAARKFVGRRVSGRTGTPGSHKFNKELAKFLDWPAERVGQALAQLVAIDAEDLSRQAVELLPTQKAATALHRAVREAKKEGKPIPKCEQVAIAKRAAKVTEGSAPEAVKREIFEHKYPAASEAKLKRLEDVVGDTARLLRNVSLNLEKILTAKSDLYSDVYRKTLEVNYLMTALRKVIGQGGELLREDEHHAEKEEGNHSGENRKSLSYTH